MFGAIFSELDVRDYKGVCAMSTQDMPKEFELPIIRIKNQLNVGSCHDKDTEVLTKDGWKFFEDITYDDLLASVDPNSGNMIFENPVNITKEKYCGEMVYGKHQSLDFMVTPNHKMVVRKWNESERKLDTDYQFIDADNLGWYVGFKTDFHQNKGDSPNIVFEEEKIANGNTLNRMEISMDDWVQLLGIYLAEGTLYKDGEKYHHRIQLAAVKKREKDFIRELLKRIGINGINEQKDRFHFHNKRIWKKFEEYGLVGVKSYDKFVPNFIFNLDEKYIKKFLYAFAMGDGNFKENGIVHFYTSSQKLADQLQMLLLMCGTYNKICEQTPENKTKIVAQGRVIQQKHVAYTIVGWKSNNLSADRKKHISRVNYDGYVYCAEVPTYHTLITRRNRCILLSGNCVAHALSSVVEYYNYIQHNSKTEMSTGYIYGNRTKTLHKSSGMIVRDALSTLVKYGDVEKKDFPYNIEVPEAIEKFNAQADELFEKGYPNRISCYYKLKTEDDVKASLLSNNPVVMAMQWYSDMKVVDGILTTNYKTNRGGHCMLIYGWNEKGWKVQNSWGERWGNKGTCIIPYDMKIREMWSVTDNITDKINVKKPFSSDVGKYIAKLINIIGRIINNLNKQK